MSEGDSAETCTGKFPLMSMGGRAEGLVFADPGVRNPIGMSGFFLFIFILTLSQMLDPVRNKKKYIFDESRMNARYMTVPTLLTMPVIQQI